MFSALIVLCRCANHREVFVGGEIYFTDADCYARMTRARICFEHPGTIVRHHSFENYPAGTTPHTTAPFDYLIVCVAACLRPFSTHALELAGAIVSPIVALIGGWFLWSWARAIKLPVRPAMLLLYATSPILVHGTELGRPDHQSLLILLTIVALCAEWSLQILPSRGWSIVSGAAWGVALWVSFYEPLVLLAVLLMSYAIFARQNFSAPHRRIGWIVLASLVVLAAAIERRSVQFAIGDDELFARWSATIGELRPVPLISATWLEWSGYLLLAAPVLLVLTYRRRAAPPPVMVILALTTFCLTLWQARWGYFFVALFVLLTPTMLAAVKRRRVAVAIAICAMFPILKWWDAAIWPNESDAAARLERRAEMQQWRRAAAVLSQAHSGGAVLAPWWLSPAVAYWSHQNAVAGSSHESLSGIADTARFFLTDDRQVAKSIVARHGARWVLAYDAERTIANSAAILGRTAPAMPFAAVLDRTPSRAPPFLTPVYENGSCKVFAAQTFE